jgi:predicted phosphodiesterase
MKQHGPVLFCGDAHGEFDHIVRCATELKASAVVMLGDIEARRPLHLDLGPIKDITWLIHGNHDTDSVCCFESLWDSELGPRNIHGKVVTLPDGTRVAGVGGVFRGKVWYGDESKHFHSPEELARVTPRQVKWRGGPVLTHWSTIFPETIEKLGELKADVLVTHEAPSCHPHGFAVLDALASAMGVKRVFHGHQHDNLDYSAHEKSLGFRVHGVGLRGITNQDGVVVRPGMLDERRSYRKAFGAV